MSISAYQRRQLLDALEKGDVDALETLVTINPFLIQFKTKEGKNLLHVAVLSQSPTSHLIVEYVCSKLGLDINAMDDSGMTPLHLAAVQQNDIAMVKCICALDANINATLKGEKNEATALHLACNHAHDAIVDYLIEQGADKYLMSGKYNTLQCASFPGGNEPQRLIITKRLLRDDPPFTTFMLTKQPGMDVPIGLASYFGYANIVRYLIEMGAEDFVNHACLRGDLEALKTMERNGADLSLPQVGDDGVVDQYPFVCAADSGGDATVNANKFLVLKYLSSLPSIDINVCNKQSRQAAIHHAAYYGHFEMVEHLVQLGVKVNVLDIFNQSPLGKAVQAGRVDVVGLLLPLYAPDRILKCARVNALSMYEAFAHLSLQKPIGSRYMTNNLLQPGESAFFQSPNPLLTYDIGGWWNYNPSFLTYRYESTSWMDYPRKLWMTKFSPQNPTYSVQEYKLPLKYLSDFNLLKAFVHVSIKTDRPELFSNEVVGLAVDCAWIQYGRSYHTVILLLYVILLACVSFTNYTFFSWPQTDSLVYSITSWVIVAITLFLNSIFFGMELNQMRMEYRDENLPAYLTDFSTTADWSAHLLLYAATILRVLVGQESYNASSIMAVTLLLLWLKLFQYLRPYKSTGATIRMIFYIADSIKEFIVILALIVFCFAQALFLLSYGDDSLDFADPAEGFIKAFLYMMGGSQLDQMTGSSNPDLAQFLLCMFIFSTTILLLNLLIALMNNSYSTIQKNAEAEGKRLRAQMMIEQFRFWDLEIEPFHYYLVREDDRKRRLQASGGAKN